MLWSIFVRTHVHIYEHKGFPLIWNHAKYQIVAHVIMATDPFSREEDATSFSGNRWFYMYGIDFFIIDEEIPEKFTFMPGVYFHRVNTDDFPDFDTLVKMLKFRKNEAKRIFRYFHPRLCYVIEVNEKELYSAYLREDPINFQSTELSRKIRDGLPRQVMNLLKLINPFFFTPLSSTLPLHECHLENEAIIDLVDEFSTTAKIQNGTVFTKQHLELIAHLFDYYHRFDTHADTKQQQRLERAFDTIHMSMSIIDPRLRVLNYWMGIETLLKVEGGFNVRIPQAVALLMDCPAYYLCTSEGVIFDEETRKKCNEYRFERQEQVKKIYLKRGKITHGQYDSPFEHQHSSEEWVKYQKEIEHIEDETFRFLSGIILGIISLGHIPKLKEFDKANVDGFLVRKNLEKVRKPDS